MHDMMEDIAEQQDVAKEISDAISNPVAFGKFCLSFFMILQLNVIKKNLSTRN